MTFDELKAAVIDNVKKAEICPQFQQLLKATSYAQLIAAGTEGGIDAVVWCYQCGILTDDLLGEIPESELNDAGIYTTGSISLVNPTGNIYILKDAIVSATMNGDVNCNIHNMGSGTVNLGLSGNAYCELKAYNETTTVIELTETSSVNSSGLHNSNLSIAAKDNSVAYLSCTNEVSAQLQGSENAYANVKTFVNAETKITLSGNASADTSSAGGSSVIVIPPTPDLVSVQDFSLVDDNPTDLKLRWTYNDPSSVKMVSIQIKKNSDTAYPAEIHHFSIGEDTYTTVSLYSIYTLSPDTYYDIKLIPTDVNSVDGEVFTTTIKTGE